MADMSSISFIVAAYNEEKDLENAVCLLLGRLADYDIKDYEIFVVVDSKTTDSTLVIAQKLADSYPGITVINRLENRSLGLILANGLKLVKKEYYCLYSGKDQYEPQSFDYIFPLLGRADIIACYVGNSENRPWFRRLASRVNVALINALFGLDLPYYHFYFCRTSFAKQVPISSPSYSSMAEILIWLLKSGATFLPAPIYFKQQGPKSSAMKVKNIVGILSAYAKLFWKIRILGQRIDLGR